MIKQLKYGKNWRFLSRLTGQRNESGQSLIILAFAFLGLIAMLGLALDLGLVYVERVRLKRTVDAAALAAVAELPSEEEAARRAIQYLAENGYNVANSNIYVAGCLQDGRQLYQTTSTDYLVNVPPSTVTIQPTSTLTISWQLFYPFQTPGQDGSLPPDNKKQTSFYIDTWSFQGDDRGTPKACSSGERISAGASIFGAANKIKIYGQVPVKMSFMQFFGFPEVVVSDSAVAQSASSLDVVVAMDSTGSMEFDTICYGCWERCDSSNVSAACAADGDSIYSAYPRNGRGFPYNYYTTTMQSLIYGNGGITATHTPGQPKPSGANNYIVLEAEFYSNNTSVWDPAYRPSDRGYWAIQRQSGTTATSIDNRPGFVRHHPYYQTSDSLKPFGHRYLLADAQGTTQYTPPRLEYDFIPTWPSTATTYIHFKTQYFSDSRNTDPDNEFFWGINNADGTVDVSPQSAVGGSSNTNYSAGSSWSWVTVNAGTLTKNMTHTLNIWAGSPGYAIDRIIITSQSLEDSPADLRSQPATPGSAQRLAADPCNVIFGLYVLPNQCTYITLYNATNNLNDPLFGDLQPIRGAKESVKAFFMRLDPDIDQAGFVDFDTTGRQASQLECQRAARARKGSPPQLPLYPGGMPGGQDYDETNCSDAPVSNIPPISYTLVISGVEAATAGDNTDIADGMRQSLWELGIATDNDGAQSNNCNWTKSGNTWVIGGSSHCGRGQAATPVIVVMTDGAPTDSSPGDNSECTVAPNPKPYDTYPTGDDKFDCIMYYAQQAANHGVIVYTIGLGAGADSDLLKAVADLSHGTYYYAPSAAQLNLIFDQILANIYVSLVQ